MATLAEVSEFLWPPKLDRQRWITLAVVTGLSTLFVGLALARYLTFHNETFDLAFYARMAWGYVHGNLWDPLLGASILGLHVSPVLAPLGAIGFAYDTSVVLLVVQGVALGLAALPLARMGARRLGLWGAPLATVSFLLHPNLGDVATFEFHPGTLAVLPLAFAMDALDRRDARALTWSVLGVLACREDLGLGTAVMGLVASLHSETRRAGVLIAIGSFAYVLLFVIVLHPHFAPETGSLEAHFGKWGDSLAEVLFTWLTSPREVLAHLATPARLAYLPKVLFPLAFLPLLAPRYLLLALPVLAVNLLSEFPKATDLDSHYLTPALPALVAGAVLGADRLRAWRPRVGRVALPAWLGVTLLGYVLLGGTPLALGFSAEAFTDDARARAARRILAQVPDEASIQAPEPLLAHLAERQRFHFPPPPERSTDFVILDVSHRRSYVGDGSLLRTLEEPIVLGWLARPDHALVAAEEPWLLLERGADPRTGLGMRAVVGKADPREGTPLTSCLSLLSGTRDGSRVALELVARGPCPRDLALRFGHAQPPEYVDLMADGLLSPVHVRAGDRIRSVHDVAHLVRAGVLEVGTVRSSGARPEPTDPVAVAVRIAGSN